MKTTPRFMSSAFFGSSLPCLFVLSLAPAPAADPAKPYTLFMGVDFSVQKDKEFYRVRDVNGGDFVVRVGNQEVSIPMHKGLGTLKVDQSFKITGLAAKIDHLKAERAYTAANDPFVKFRGRAGAGNSAEAALDLQRFQAGELQMARAAASTDLQNARQGGNAAQIAAAQSNLDGISHQSSMADLNVDSAAYQQVKMDFNNTGLAALELQAALAEENFDAMRYSFELSSEATLDRPYLVFIVHYHEKDARPGAGKGTVVYAKAIEPVGPAPKKFHILQTGMPIGFVVDECQVRLYNRGAEVATNVAPRRMEMSKDEAFTFLKIDRIGRAKGATLPAAPAVGRPDEATLSTLTLDQRRTTYFVKVSKDGRAEAVFLDQACTEPADEQVVGIVNAMRFYPALEGGKEQPGVAKLLFSQVPI